MGLYFSQMRCFLYDAKRYLATSLHVVALYAEYILRIDMFAIIPKRNIMYKVADQINYSEHTKYVGANVYV
jgi:hypothetical protein